MVGNNVMEALSAATQLTQRGKLDAAERILSGLRSTMEIPDHPIVAVQIMVTEGCIAAYRGQWDHSRDRLERARLLSSRIGDKSSELLASAWLSYLSFIAGDFDTCVSLARRVIQERENASDFALFRVCGIIVLSLHLAGRSIEAEEWFKYTKRLAESLHEPGATSVIIFDIAATRASNHRFENRNATKFHESEIGLDLLFARSARNFDEMSSISVMPVLHLLLEAQILNSLGRFDEAKTILNEALSSPEPLPAPASNQARLEMLWASANCSDNKKDLGDPEEWQSEITQLVDDDDIAVYCHRASRVLMTAGLRDKGEEFESRANDAAERFLAIREGLWSILKPVHNMVAELPLP